MPFAALDLHKKVVEAIVLDDAGAVLHRDRFPATREALTAFAQTHLSPDCHLALEATTNTWAVVSLLAPYVAEVVLSNPLKARVLRQDSTERAKLVADGTRLKNRIHIKSAE